MRATLSVSSRSISLASRPQRRFRVTATMSGLEPTINFDQVTDHVVVGSCLRNAADAEKARAGGVSVVVSLQDAADLAAQGIDADAVAADCAAAGVRHVRVPTSDVDEAALRGALPAAVAAFAREVAAAGEAGSSAYIHCNGGRGRAPTVVTAYLYWLTGAALGEAVATMTNGRSSQPKVHVIAAATADLLGSSDVAPREALNTEERAAIAARLAESA